jgi:hypothetical protein
MQKSNCVNLKAWNGQNQGKFAGMADTGCVHVQCSHVFIHAAVDLQVGER